MRKLLEQYVERIEWEGDGRPSRLFPFTRGGHGGDTRFILIDPEIAFGKPVVARKYVSTGALVQRVDAGEDLQAVAADYGLEVEEVEEALVYARAA